MPDGGFPHSDIAGSSRVHTPDQRFAQCATSFLGRRWLGIHPTPFFPCFSVATETWLLQRVTFLLAFSFVLYELGKVRLTACSSPRPASAGAGLRFVGWAEAWAPQAWTALADSLATFSPPVNPVETRGLEPRPSCLQSKRSPN